SFLRWVRVELPREKSRSGLQNLVRPAQLPVLTPKLFELLALITGDPVADPMIDLVLANPEPERLRRHPEPARHRLDTRPSRAILALVLEHESDRTLPHLTRIPPRSSHRLHPLKGKSLQQTRGGSLRPDRRAQRRSGIPGLCSCSRSRALRRAGRPCGSRPR